jgi:ferric-dicitrate binding protein FerR (iron transport regulator)
VIDHKIRSRSASWLAFLLFALASLGVVPQARAETVAGSISVLVGSATITRGGANIPAVNGAKVDVGDRLATAAGSNLTVTLSDGSQIELTDSSTLTIDENTLDANGARASTKLSLLNGLVHSIVRTTPGTPPNYEVHTPNAVAAVRGTDFEIDHQTGVQDKKFPGCYEFSHVSVHEGIVEVYNPKNPGSPKVEVKKGHKALVPCSGAIVGAGVGLGIGAGTVAVGAVGAGGAAVGGIAAGGVFNGGGGPNSPAPNAVSPTE